MTAVYKGYSYELLKETFDKVHLPDDWKAPIAVTVPGELVNLTVASIEFFTGTTPQVTYLPPKEFDLCIRYMIESEGYRNGPAGP